MPYLLQQLLESSAAHHPDKTAVVYKRDGLTYSELDGVSARLAHTLRVHGIERGDRVGIYLSKSIESVAAIFGILKAGAVYVPLDPSAPPKRVAFIIDNCRMKGLVTTQEKLAGLRPVLPECSPLQCVILADRRPSARQEASAGETYVAWKDALELPSSSLPPIETMENDLAYILYTSGSTGVPKGVMISHRASLTFVNWAHDCFQVQPTDRISNHAPLHFDLSIFDIFAAIEAGATVILVPEELSLFPISLTDFIEEERITIWYSVPSVLTRLVLHGKLERYQFRHLRKILFAGEVFPVKYLRRAKALIPHAEYYNLYGPTETNVCTYYHVTNPLPDEDEPFRIGKACANTEVFAVNDRGEIASPDETGELYVRGPSLMHGYWGMPEKTREVLRPHPLRPSLWEERVYRTGDLVKQNPEGNYLFLGRRDSMIKSRGYRIELGEIESVLYSHPQIEEVAVLAIPDEQIGHVIKAVVVTRNGSGLAQRELESFCSHHIPKYMIPACIEFATSLPKTSTGKIDKTSLLKAHLAGRPD